MTVGNAKQAQKVIEAYATSLDGLTQRSCQKIGIDEARCTTLRQVLGLGAGGMVTSDERSQLKQAKFSDEFIQHLAGVDGKRALQERVKWLSKHAVYRWWRIFGEKTDEERIAILRELGNIGPEAHTALPQLRDGLKECYREEQLRRGDPLSSSKFSDVQNVCIETATATSKIGVSAVPNLLEMLRKGDIHMRRIAARALVQLGKSDISEVISVLAHELMDKDAKWQAREIAANMLISIGYPAVPVLLSVVKQSDEPKVRGTAAFALGSIGAAEAITGLEKAMLFDPDANVRDRALSALARIGRPSIPVLEMALNHVNPDVRIKVATALIHIGEKTSLIKMLKHRDGAICKIAAKATEDMQVTEAIPELEKTFTGNSNPTCQKTAEHAFLKLKYPATQPVFK
jgi:hypothetical protein